MSKRLVIKNVNKYIKRPNQRPAFYSVYPQNRGFSYNKPRGLLGEKEVVQSTRHMLRATVNLKALNIGKREHG